MQSFYKVGLYFIFFITSAPYCYSFNTVHAMEARPELTRDEDDQPVYLDKNDPIYKTIKAQAIPNLKEFWQKADPANAKNVAMRAKMQTWPKEKQDEAQAMFGTLLNDYSEQTGLDVGIFMLVFEVMGTMDEQQLRKDYDIRVRKLDGNKYVAEFFEDGIAVNSEAHALASTDNPEYQAAAKETYANVRKAIEEGKQERYSKVMALLYTQEKNGMLIFHDPGQDMYDYVEKQK